MNKAKAQKEIYKRFRDNFGNREAEQVLERPDLILKATNFLTKQACEHCRKKILKKVAEGKSFKPIWLCTICEQKYKEVAK